MFRSDICLDIYTAYADTARTERKDGFERSARPSHTAVSANYRPLFQRGINRIPSSVPFSSHSKSTASYRLETSEACIHVVGQTSLPSKIGKTVGVLSLSRYISSGEDVLGVGVSESRALPGSRLPDGHLFG